MIEYIALPHNLSDREQRRAAHSEIPSIGRSPVNRRAWFATLLLIGVGSSSLHAACPGGVSNSFTVSGEVTNRAVFNLNKLEQFAPAQQNVTYFAAGSVVTESFTGVLLWDLLNNSPVGGIVTDPTVKNDILHKVVIVTGTDCYQSVFGAGEFDPFFGGSQIMVAYATGGQSLGSDGFARIVVPGDKAGGRFVSNIVSIEVRDPTTH
jgi:hypothetical protein